MPALATPNGAHEALSTYSSLGRPPSARRDRPRRHAPAAARRLGIDHSTVFRRLRTIEATLGTPLFERGPGGYVPTQAGTELVTLAARVDEDLVAALRRIAGQAPSPAGDVRIATSDLLLFELVLPLLAEFRAQCPAIRLDLVTGNTPLNLSRRDADVAIRATTAPPDTLVGRNVARIAWAPYATQALVNETSADRLLSEGPWVGFGDALAGLPGAVRLRSLPTERSACRFDTIGGLLAGVSAGLGVGLLPCFAGDTRADLVRLEPPDPALDADLWLLTHPDLRHAPRIRLVLDFLAEHLIARRPLIGGALKRETRSHEPRPKTARPAVPR